MDFKNAITSGLQRWSDFSSRSSRSEFWWFILFIILVSIAAGFIDGIIGTAPAIGLIVGLALLIPNIAVGVRRLHDIDMSGWWMLISIVPFVSLILIYFCCKKGTEGPNRFGPNPLSVGGTGVQDRYPSP